MKCSRVAMVVAITSALSAGSALAQSGSQPNSVHPTTFENYGGYYAQEASPSDAVVPPETGAPPAAGCNCPSDCDTGCDWCRPPLECCEDDPWRLFPCINDCGWFATGWVNGGITANSDNPASHFNGPIGFNDRDEFQLNQVYLTFGKEAFTGGCGWALGGQVDLLYGTDARYVAAFGLETNGAGDFDWDSGRFYGLAMPQAYAEVAYNDLSIKIGHFYSIVGYETIPAAGNFFYSHSYTLLYGEPFTHTGVLATYRYSDTTTLLGGIDRGWNNWESPEEADTLRALGGFTWQNDNGFSVAWSGTVGKEPGAPGVFDDRYLSSFVLSKDISDRMTYVFQNDIGRQQGALANGDHAEWYGINQYLFYKLNCCWTAGARMEWFRDDDGFRVAGRGDNQGLGNPSSVGGFAGDFYNVTLGLNWIPNANLIVRPELRYDWFNGAGNPYDDLTSQDQFTAAIDAIFKY